MRAALGSEFLAKPVFQLLICPVIDNTATEATVWQKSQHAPFLTPARMKWYRGKYFVHSADAGLWNASPCFADEGTLSGSPSTFIAVAECDLLADEAISYGNQLKEVGVETTVKIYKGATHSILLLAGYVTS